MAFMVLWNLWFVSHFRYFISPFWRNVLCYLAFARVCYNSLQLQLRSCSSHSKADEITFHEKLHSTREFFWYYSKLKDVFNNIINLTGEINDLLISKIISENWEMWWKILSFGLQFGGGVWCKYGVTSIHR